MVMPEKLTDELQEKIVLYIRTGAYIETAAKAAGISKDTFYKWLQNGRRKKGKKYEIFLAAIDKALAESELSDIARIGQAAKDGNWQAAAWRLERKFPQRWARTEKQKLEHSGPDGKPIQMQPVVNHELIVADAKKRLEDAEDGEDFE